MTPPSTCLRPTYGRVEVDDGRVVVGRALVSALMWTMPVETLRIFTKHCAGVLLVVDQQPVGALSPDAADEPFCERVGRRSQLHRMRTIGTDVFG